MTWLRRLYLKWLDRHDPAWKPTGIRPKTALHYEQEQAIRMARKARRRSATGRLYNATKVPSTSTKVLVGLRRVK